MIVLIKIYNFISCIYSVFINLSILFKLFIKNPKSFINDVKLCKYYFSDIKQKFQVIDKMKTFSYIPDPDMKILNKILRKITGKEYILKWDFIPWIFTFFIRDGSDCSGFSHIYKKLFKQIKLKAKQYVIYDNVGNFLEKIMTLHMVTIIKYFGKQIIYNVNNEEKYDGFIESFFKLGKVIRNGKVYKYKKPVVVKWL